MSSSASEFYRCFLAQQRTGTHFASKNRIDSEFSVFSHALYYPSKRLFRSSIKMRPTITAKDGRLTRRWYSNIASFECDDDQVFLSSESEESDTELLSTSVVALDADFGITHEDKLDDSESDFTQSAHRITTTHCHRCWKRQIIPGVFINIGLFIFLIIFLLLIDSWAWRIVRIPLEPFYMTFPFATSSLFSACAGYMYVPLLHIMKFYSTTRKKCPSLHSCKKGTPTMGGLFFVPIGIAVARTLVGFSSVEVYGAAVVTLAFTAIGFIDDLLSIARNSNHGISRFIKFLLQVAICVWFCFWLDTTKISSPYNMKLLVPLPSPFGLVYLGKFYYFLTAFCFVSMVNGVDLIDGLDGLAGGTIALALLGMSIAVLPICPDLAIFGASMGGCCIGFLCHNRLKASVFMGDTGSMALGGALAAMAASTGMFLPLFVSTGVFVLEVFSVIIQVSYFKATRYVSRSRSRLFRVAHFHELLELSGLKKPVVVANCMFISLRYVPLHQTLQSKLQPMSRNGGDLQEQTSSQRPRTMVAAESLTEKETQIELMEYYLIHYLCSIWLNKHSTKQEKPSMKQVEPTSSKALKAKHEVSTVNSACLTATTR